MFLYTKFENRLNCALLLEVKMVVMPGGRVVTGTGYTGAFWFVSNVLCLLCEDKVTLYFIIWTLFCRYVMHQKQVCIKTNRERLDYLLSKDD